MNFTPSQTDAFNTIDKNLQIIACAGSGKYIEFINRDENIDFDEKMGVLQAEFTELLKAEAASRKDLLKVF
jgi:hypothetical protein